MRSREIESTKVERDYWCRVSTLTSRARRTKPLLKARVHTEDITLNKILCFYRYIIMHARKENFWDKVIDAPMLLWHCPESADFRSGAQQS